MLIVDNSKKLLDIMEFNPKQSYYRFVCMIREKDYKNNPVNQLLTVKDKQEILIRSWNIDSKEVLEKTLPDMLALTDLLKCRLYMCVDRKSTIKTMLNMRNKLNVQLDHFIANPKADVSVKAINKIPYSASADSEASDNGHHKWLFDIDTKSLSLVNHIIYIANLYEAHPTTFETKNGYHIVCDRNFNANIWLSKMPDKAFEFGKQMEWLDNQNRLMVEVKDNAMVLIAMGE